MELDDFLIRGPRVASAVRFVKHAGDTRSAPALLWRWDIGGYTGKAVSIAEVSGADSKAAAYDLICWTLPNNAELQPADFQVDSMVDGSVYRIQRRNGTAFKIARVSGVRVDTTIPGFSTCTP